MSARDEGTRGPAIRTQIVVLVLAVVVPAAALLAYTVSLYIDRELRHEQRGLRAAARHIARSIGRDLGDARATMSRLAALPMVRKMDPGSCDPAFELLPALDPRVDQLGLRALDGRLICSYLPHALRSIPRTDPWFARGLRSGGFSVGGAWFGHNTGRWVTVLTYPVRGASGARVGELVLPLDLAELARRNVAPYADRFATRVLDGEGRLLMSAGAGSQRVGEAPVLDGLDAAGLRAVPGVTEFRDRAGRAFMRAAFAVPGTDWVVMVVQPRDALVSAAWRQAQPILWLGLVTAVLLTLLAFMLARRIARPIRAIGAAAAAVAGGDVSVRVAPSGPTELQAVAVEFNRMLEAKVLVDRETHEHQQWASKLIENASDLVFIVDIGRIIRYASPSVGDIAGYAQEEVLGHDYLEFIPRSEAESFVSGLERVAGNGGGVWFVEGRFRHREGQWLPIETVARSALEDPTLNGVVVSVRDLSERKRSMAALGRMKDFYQLLSEVNQAIVRKSSAEELFVEVCRAAVEHTHVRFAAVALLEGEGPRIRIAQKYGEDRGYLDALPMSVSAGEAIGLGPIGTSVREDRAVICNDFEHDRATEAWREAAARAGVRACAAFPLRMAGRAVGALCLWAEETAFFVSDIVPMLDQVAMDVSFALANFAREAERKRAQEELQFRDTVLRTQQETSLDGILVVGGDARIISYNARFLELWHAPQEIMTNGQEAPLLRWAAGQVEDGAGFIARVGDLYADRGAKGQEELALKDGRTITRYSAPVVGPGGEYYGRVWYFRDITERKQAERALAESEAKYRGLVEQDLAGICIAQDERFVYTNPFFAQLFGYAVEELAGRDVLEIVAPQDHALVRENFRKRLAGEVGSLQYSFCGQRKDGSRFTVGAHGSLSTLGGRPAIISLVQDVTERARAEELAKAHVAELERAMSGTIAAVSAMVEMRDPYTAGHERRVSELASAMAEEMGLPEATVQAIRIAGALHDIGKMGCPSEILTKPSRLSAAEFELIKVHAQLGYEILKSVQFPWPIAEIVLQHHERLDGSGYPNGLKGDDIGIEARILAVADTVESMASHRPYRPALGVDKALEEIEARSGVLYDPQVVAACVRLFEEKGFTLDTLARAEAAHRERSAAPAS